MSCKLEIHYTIQKGKVRCMIITNAATPLAETQMIIHGYRLLIRLTQLNKRIATMRRFKKNIYINLHTIILQYWSQFGRS